MTLCITMLGVMTLWTGVLEIGHRSGLVDQLARRMGPVLTFLFPRLDPDGEARKQISVNMIANILGLGCLLYTSHIIHHRISNAFSIFTPSVSFSFFIATF